MIETRSAFDWDRAWARTMPTYIFRLEPPPLDVTLLNLRATVAECWRQPRRPFRPRLHPTKGYRGAHKRFRGGSR